MPNSELWHPCRKTAIRLWSDGVRDKKKC
jgi:hypothetical protein